MSNMLYGQYIDDTDYYTAYGVHHIPRSRTPWEIVKQVFAVLHEWHIALEDGSANNRYPGPDIAVTEEQADELIEVLDNYSFYELEQNSSWHKLKNQTDAPWCFGRLAPHARLVFYEEVKRAFEPVVNTGERKMIPLELDFGGGS